MAEISLTLTLSQMERGQELLLSSPQGEELGMRANHIGIQQHLIFFRIDCAITLLMLQKQANKDDY
jgi:hypothetical protein